MAAVVLSRESEKLWTVAGPWNLSLRAYVTVSSSSELCYHKPSQLILNITGLQGHHTTFLHINDSIYLLQVFIVDIEHHRTSWSSHNITTYHWHHIPTTSLHSKYWTSQDIMVIMVITQHYYISMTSYTYYMPSLEHHRTSWSSQNITTYQWHHIPTTCLQS